MGASTDDTAGAPAGETAGATTGETAGAPSSTDVNQGDGSTSVCGPYNVTGDCFPRNMDPFQRVTLKEKLEYFVPNLTQEYNDPRFQWFVELHNR